MAISNKVVTERTYQSACWPCLAGSNPIIQSYYYIGAGIGFAFRLSWLNYVCISIIDACSLCQVIALR